MPTYKTINGQQVVFYTLEELKHFVSYTLCHGKGLTDWELKFMKDMEKQLEKYGKTSPKQQEIIERIYAEKTS